VIVLHTGKTDDVGGCLTSHDTYVLRPGVLALAQILDAGAAAWPDVRVDPQALVAALARIGIEPDASIDSTGEPRAFPGDLFLAAACLAGDPRALRHFDDRMLGPALSAARIAPAERDEIAQRLRIRLLAAPDAQLDRYRGRAPLVGWLRVVALREALDAARSRTPQWSSLGRLGRAAESRDPELELFRARHGDAFRDAFRTAVTTLPSEHRAALRLYLVHELNLEGIARALQIGRATAGRWLLAARAHILRITREQLGIELALSPSQLSSAVRALRTIDLDLGALL
jgi:RNA polymerase sigma-70 factor, ECF subfamily